MGSTLGVGAGSGGAGSGGNDNRRYTTNGVGLGGFYKTAFFCALTAIGALLMGQFQPNRNIVTNDQMMAIVEPLKSDIRELTGEVNVLNTKLASKDGAEAERQELERQQYRDRVNNDRH